MRMSRLLIAFLVVLALNVTAASAADTYNLGYCEILSGAFKHTGERALRFFRAQVNELNEAGGILEKKVEVIAEDNQMKPDIAVQKVKKLILKDGVQAVFQGASSAVGGAIAQAMPRYKKLYINEGARAMGMTGENFTPYTFRVTSNAAMQAKALAIYFSKQKVYKKVFLLNQDYSWGHDVAKYYEMYIERLAPETQVVGKDFHPVFNKDFGPYLSKIKASGADYIISGNWGSDMTQLIIQSRKLGIKIPIGGLFIADTEILGIARESAIGCINAADFYLGMDQPGMRQYEEHVKKMIGEWPEFANYETYYGNKMYFKAANMAGTEDVGAVIKAFEGLSMETPLGTYTMRREDHQMQLPMVIAEVVRGKNRYYDFPYFKVREIIPAEKLSVSLKESGWKPWKK